MKRTFFAVLAAAVVFTGLGANRLLAQTDGEIGDMSSDGDATVTMDLSNEMDAMSGAAAGMLTIILLVSALPALLIIISFWKIFAKSGQPGVAAIVPIWQLVALCKAAGRPGWWWLIPIVPAFTIPFDLAKQFGKGGGFGAGLLFLPYIFYPVLAFGSAQHVSQGSAEGGMLTEEAGGGDTAATFAPRDGSNYALPAWLAIAATICLLIVLAMQLVEYNYYKSNAPRGPAWPPPVIPIGE